MKTVGKQTFRVLFLSVCLFAANLCCESQITVKPDGDTGPVREIISIGGEVWLGTAMGAFRLDSKNNRFVRVSGETYGVQAIVPVGGDIWLETNRGVFRVERGSNQAVLVSSEPEYVVWMAPVGEEVWWDSEHGLFRSERNSNRAVPILIKRDIGSVEHAVPVAEEVWLGTDMGAFRYQPKTGDVVPVGGETGRVMSIIPDGDSIWLGTDKGAFRYDTRTNQTAAVGGNTGAVHTIVPMTEEVWLLTSGGAFRFDRTNGRVIQVSGDTGGAYDVVSLGNEIWLRTMNGAFRFDRKTNQATQLSGNSGTVYSIVPVGEELWFSAEKGAFRFNRRTDQLEVVRFGDIKSPGLVRVGNELWISSESGAFKVDLSTDIVVQLEGLAPLLSGLLATPVWFEGDSRPVVHYLDSVTHKDKYDASQVEWIKVVDDKDASKLKQEMNNPNNWVLLTASAPVIPLKPGRAQLQFAVWDSWGNKTVVASVNGWILPSWSLVSLLPIVGIGACLTCLGLAPHVRYCHMLLMNPFLRNWVSFGTVPLLLTTVPPLRRYIFRRYCNGITTDPALRQLTARYVVPDSGFSPLEFGNDLSKHKVMCIHGESGIGKSAFLGYLTYQVALWNNAQRPFLHRLVPVLVDLSVVEHVQPQVMVRSKLEKYGDLTDEKLTDVLLQYGGFVFLFDGLNEVSDALLKAIIAFVDKHRNHSFACLSTQSVTNELRTISTLKAGCLLSRERINEVVRLASRDVRTNSLIFDPTPLLESFSDEAYELSRVPLQLELILEMWQQSSTLPKSLDQLYLYFLGPQLDKDLWSAKGHADYPDILSCLAFDMLTNRRPYDPKRDYLPEELEAELVRRRLLLERNEVFEFRHDRIRAYLAAKYFSERWRTILIDEKTVVDSNWDVMLQFHITQEEDPTQARSLLLLLLTKNMDTAIRLNVWGRANRLDVFSSWQDDFSREVGKTILDGRQESNA